eukprot:7008388-Prymnesium_polylepis.1
MEWFPIFSSHEELERFNSTWSAGRTTQLAEGWATPLVIRADEANPPTSQKWRALRIVFTQHEAQYAITLDPETALVGEARASHVRARLANWSERKMVLGSSWTPRVGGGYFARRPPVQINATNA